MALRVWLPLNGDLHNQGINGNTPTLQNGTASFDNNGKIGKCFDNCSIGSNIIIPYDFYQTNELTIAFWIKPNSPGAWTDLFSIGQYANRMETNTTTGDMYYWFNDDNNYGIGASSTALFSIPNAVWTHICCTIGDNLIKIYKNGVLSKSFAQTHTIAAAIGNNPKIFIGLRRPSENNYYHGYYNDIRVYDHCLSPKEVKEISKGLILHYKLDANNLNNLNLFTRELSIISTKNNYSIIGGLNSIPAATILANKGKTLTLSYNVSSIGDFVSTSNGWQKDRFGIHGSCNYTLNGGSAIQDYPLANLLSRGKISGRYYTTWTIPSNLSSVNSDLSFAIQTNPAEGFSKPASTNDEIWFLNNVKLEWGSIPTLYDGPGAEDYSGYQNNGTIVGNIIATNDTPRYNSSSKFDTNAYIVREDHNLLNLVNGSNASITISVWAKNSSSSPNSLLFGYGSAAAQNKFLLCHLYNSGAVGLCYYSNDLWSSITNFDINKWYHICYVISGMTRKIYVNGELNAQGTVTSTLSIDAATAKLMIGKDIFRNNYNSSGISDVRVYATALSDNDIKELYEVGGAIDSHYNSYAYEFIEE